MSLFNNKENELHSFEQTIEKLKADYAKLEQENISKEEEIKHLKKVIESLNENSSSKENIVTNEPILEESKQIPEIEATPVVPLPMKGSTITASGGRMPIIFFITSKGIWHGCAVLSFDTFFT